MQRRQLLQSLAGTGLALGAGQLWAAGPSQPCFLVVFLRGGYDAANLLVPVSSSFYYEVRPTIAISRPSKEANSALPLNADWGLHPALRDSVYPMFQQGQAAFVPFAGTHDLTRSHFETQDSIELGQAPEGSRNYRSGFLNRLAATLKGAGAMAFTDRLPLVMQGDVQVPNTALRAVVKPAVDARQSSIISAMYQGTQLSGSVDQGFTVRDEVIREMAAEMDAASRNAISARGFELEARRIAKLMKARYNLGFVDVGGWDTHVAQGGATGQLASRFEELGRGLAAYAQEMGTRWRETTVVVVSEFGRTFRQNGNNGTDHGHGSVYWVLGGGLRGGQVAGEQMIVTPANLFQNRDYPVLNEYRSLLGGLLARQFGLSPAQLAGVFPGAEARDLGLL
ncbi:MAG: DUF1501 domain-containing protein [Betaproteobacteria bacterium]|nr:DUF1501 domain-containing protein [Betaproteobacteria bacterium]